MIHVSKTIAHGKGHNTDEEFLYINLHGFKDKDEQEEIYFLIKDLIAQENKDD